MVPSAAFPLPSFVPPPVFGHPLPDEFLLRSILLVLPYLHGAPYPPGQCFLSCLHDPAGYSSYDVLCRWFSDLYSHPCPTCFHSLFLLFHYCFWPKSASFSGAKIVCSRERPVASANGVSAKIFLYQAGGLP